MISSLLDYHHSRIGFKDDITWVMPINLIGPMLLGGSISYVIWGTRMNKTISLSLACQTATELKCELWCSTCMGKVETELEKIVISYILKVLCPSTITHSNVPPKCYKHESTETRNKKVYPIRQQRTGSAVSNFKICSRNYRNSFILLKMWKNCAQWHQ